MEINRENLLSLITTGVKKGQLSILGLERQAGVPKDTVRDFLRGKTQVLRADKLQKIMRVLEPQQGVRITGYIREDAEIVPMPPTENIITPCPPGCEASDVSAVLIASDALLPIYHPGWVVYYSRNPDLKIPAILGGWQVPYSRMSVKNARQKGEKFSEFLDKPCVVGLGGGRMALGTLKKKASGKAYNLATYNDLDMKNIVPSWAARIIFIKTE